MWDAEVEHTGHRKGNSHSGQICTRSVFGDLLPLQCLAQSQTHSGQPAMVEDGHFPLGTLPGQG